MFSHLVESDLHTGDFKRKGSFFLATLAAYALVLMATGVVGVYAYEAHIDDQNLELVALVPPDIEEAPKENPQRQRQNQSNASAPAALSKGLSEPNRNPPSSTSTDLTKISGAPQASTNQPPPLPSGTNDRGDYRIVGGNSPFGIIGGDPNSNNKSGTNKNGGLLDEEAPEVKKPDNRKTVVSLGVINGRALNKPDPVYPPIAVTARIQGTVAVEILLDEKGNVISAHATSGHPFLRPEAERAALRTRFSPTLLSNQPVKAKGVITFNFVLKK